MKLIFAQGNPGPQYARSRHNTGFVVLDALVEARNSSGKALGDQSASTPWKPSRIANAETVEYTTPTGEKVLLVKPQSFYNETGPVARAFINFYKLNPATDLLVVHDELALPFGTIRVREKGNDAGNNGIKSLNQHLGQDYWRLRVGIWNEQRQVLDDADFVLSGFTSDEKTQLGQVIQKAVTLVDDFIQGELKAATH